MGHTSAPPRMLLALVHVEQLVTILRELARNSGHEKAPRCCRVHDLLDALQFRAKWRRQFLEWKAEDEAKREHWEHGSKGPRTDALGNPVVIKRKPKLETGKVEIRETALAARKGGAK